MHALFLHMQAHAWIEKNNARTGWNCNHNDQSYDLFLTLAWIAGKEELYAGTGRPNTSVMGLSSTGPCSCKWTAQQPKLAPKQKYSYTLCGICKSLQCANSKGCLSRVTDDLTVYSQTNCRQQWLRGIRCKLGSRISCHCPVKTRGMTSWL